MPTNGTPPPVKWPIEPTLLWVVSYYPTNANNEPPTIVALNMRTYPEAETLAKQYITDAGNTGVCTIQQVTATVVYPSIAWEDF